ncbi:Oidioi.mRNA.OKI2018_I69.XSR.g16322.t1.cds [Oikopleura dioica]|uniref:Oidioi.mRNA.OKI2018_I69.XSR.g16322.t1.cds n=1 Tax=Oikopleura dioica TaxID=34765 RepID=A0ABN7SFP8_OIKDI|nr:Oidioi.mRNA.OKI2018_I69.XSR.g16322.t1.cds [Oikopleura dioica]
MSHFENPDYDGYETAGQYTDGEYGGGTHMAESSADWGGGAYEQQYAGQSQFDRASDVGSGATEDGDEDADYIVKDGDDGRYPEKAQLEEAGYRYEAALRSCGHGKMQWMIFAALSIGLAAESIEQFVIGFILPSTQKDLCLTEERSAWLGSIAYLGLCFGALIWGGVSDKVGRRHCLLVCLSISGFFSILSAFTQGFGSFLFCRLGSSIGIGGAVPAVFSYYAEVLPREKRAEHLSWLCLSWVFGGVYAAAMAWEIIPNTGWGFAYGSEYQFHAWRVFVVVCALPSVISATALTFLPESPRWLLRSGMVVNLNCSLWL